jgi:hypothetical protein
MRMGVITTPADGRVFSQRQRQQLAIWNGIVRLRRLLAPKVRGRAGISSEVVPRRSACMSAMLHTSCDISGSRQKPSRQGGGPRQLLPHCEPAPPAQR